MTTIPERAKGVVAVDVDDVFWPFNERVAEVARINYRDIVTFATKDNPVLSPDEKRRLYAAYSTPGLHKNMDFYPGAEHFGRLVRDPRLSAWICSNSLGWGTICDKARNLRDLLANDWCRFNKMFSEITMEAAHEKRFPPDLWTLIDDSPHNAVASGAAHILMPRHPYVVSTWGQDILEPVKDRVIYYSEPEEAVEIIFTLADRDFGPLSR